MKPLIIFIVTAFLFSCDSTTPSTPDEDMREDLSRTDTSIFDDMPNAKDLGVDIAVDLAKQEDVVEDQSDFSSEDMPPEKAYGFVAQGHVGRLSYSCDGKEWDWNQSNGDNLRCYDDATGNIDCDHGSGAGNGLAHDSNFVFATFGWGQPGGIFRATDGEQWTEVLTGTTFGGLAAGKGILLAGSVRPRISMDEGTTWGEPQTLDFNGYNVRATAFAGGVFILVAQESGGNPEVRISEDAQNWSSPTSIPVECGASTRGIVSHQNNIVLHGAKSICQSEDGGKNWTLSVSGEDLGQGMIHNGTHFEYWDRSNKWSSTDGKTWNSEAMPVSMRLDTVAFGNGLYVAINGGWQEWYEKQTAFYSTDGLTWIESPSFTKSHPIRAMIYAPISACEN